MTDFEETAVIAEKEIENFYCLIKFNQLFAYVLFTILIAVNMMIVIIVTL